jgi:hypothetical protein
LGEGLSRLGLLVQEMKDLLGTRSTGEIEKMSHEVDATAAIRRPHTTLVAKHHGRARLTIQATNS